MSNDPHNPQFTALAGFRACEWSQGYAPTYLVGKPIGSDLWEVLSSAISDDERSAQADAHNASRRFNTPNETVPYRWHGCLADTTIRSTFAKPSKEFKP